MEFYDKNLSWLPPTGFICAGADAVGAYLRIKFRQPVFAAGTTRIIAENIVLVYLNDQGREVGRTKSRLDIPQPVVEAPTPAPVARRFRFWNGMLLALHGLREMLRSCQK